MCTQFCTCGVKVKHSVSTIFSSQKPNGTFKSVQFFELIVFVALYEKKPVAVNRLIYFDVDTALVNTSLFLDR